MIVVAKGLKVAHALEYWLYHKVTFLHRTVEAFQ